MQCGRFWKPFGPCTDKPRAAIPRSKKSYLPTSSFSRTPKRGTWRVYGLTGYIRDRGEEEVEEEVKVSGQRRVLELEQRRL